MAVTLRSLHTHLLRMSQDMAVEARETRMGSHMGNALTMSYGFEMNFSRSAFFLMALSRDSCFLSISSEACVSSLVFTGFVHVGVLEIETLEILELQLFNRNEGFGTPLCRQILTQAT